MKINQNDRFQHLNNYQQLELGSVQLGLGCVEGQGAFGVTSMLVTDVGDKIW